MCQYGCENFPDNDSRCEDCQLPHLDGCPCEECLAKEPMVVIRVASLAALYLAARSYDYVPHTEEELDALLEAQLLLSTYALEAN